MSYATSAMQKSEGRKSGPILLLRRVALSAIRSTAAIIPDFLTRECRNSVRAATMSKRITYQRLTRNKAASEETLQAIISTLEPV
jgi:hypothetical protein